MANVDILVIEKVRLVESTNGAISVAAEEHEHACEPIHLARAAVCRIVGFSTI